MNEALALISNLDLNTVIIILAFIPFLLIILRKVGIMKGKGTRKAINATRTTRRGLQMLRTISKMR